MAAVNLSLGLLKSCLQAMSGWCEMAAVQSWQLLRRVNFMLRAWLIK